MNDIDQELFTFITNRPAILALLSDNGTAANCRVYPDQCPQNAAYPRVSLHLISSVGETHLGGSTPLQNDVWQLSVWAQTAASRKAVSNALRAELHCAQDFYMGDVHISSCKLTNERATVAENGAGEDVPVFGNHMTFGIWYTRAETPHTL